MVDRLDRLADAVTISRRTMGIARQRVVAGMLLSLVAMVAASFGAIPPTAGALLQEGIDLAVIANALRPRGVRARGRIREVEAPIGIGAVGCPGRIVGRQPPRSQGRHGRPWATGACAWVGCPNGFARQHHGSVVHRG